MATPSADPAQASGERASRRARARGEAPPEGHGGRVRRWLGFAAGGAALFGLASGARILALRAVQRAMLVAGTPNASSPADLGMRFEALEIPSGPHRLAGWWVPAPLARDQGRALFVLHGRNETICEWIQPLRYLWEQGISAFVFDYSGFGASTGAATVRALRRDVRAAWRVFREKAAGRRRYALGLSLGTGFLLDGLAELGGEIEGAVLVAPFSSARRAAVETGVVPAFLSLLLPDLLDNVAAARRAAVPLLVICSRDDDLLPCSMAEQVYAAAPGPKRLVALKGLRHRDLLKEGHQRVLAPVVEFMEETPAESAAVRPGAGPRPAVSSG